MRASDKTLVAFLVGLLLFLLFATGVGLKVYRSVSSNTDVGSSTMEYVDNPQVAEDQVDDYNEAWEEEYLYYVSETLNAINEAEMNLRENLQDYALNPELYYSDEWVESTVNYIRIIEDNAEFGMTLQAPSSYTEFDDEMKDALDSYLFVTTYLPEAIDDSNLTLLNEVAEHLDYASSFLDYVYTETLNNF